MNTRFVVLKMEKNERFNQIEVTIMFEEKLYVYQVGYGGWLGGIKIPSELEKIATAPVERGRKFINLVFQFLEGKVIDFPVDIT